MKSTSVTLFRYVNTQKHIIQKLSIEMGLEKQEEAFDLQTRVSANHERLMLRSLEDLFDKLVGEDEVVKIEKLEIDLGEISMNNIDQELPGKLKAEMEEALVKILHEIRTSAAHSAEVRMQLSSGEFINVNASVQQQPHSQFETLLYLLEFGVLPWSEDRKEKPSLRKLLAEAMAHYPEHLRKSLQRFSSKPFVFRRLALQIPEDQWQYLAAILGCGFSAQLPALLAGLEPLPEILQTFRNAAKKGEQVSRTALRQWLREETLLYFASVESADETLSGSKEAGYILKLLEKLFSEWNITADVFVVRVLKGKLSNAGGPAVKIALNAMLEAAKQAEKKRIEELKKEKARKKNAPAEASDEAAEILNNEETPGEETESRRAKQLSEEAIKIQQAKKAAAEQAVKALLKPNTPDFPETPEAEQGIYISNAGLVLLALYLPPFFRNLGLVQGKEFVDEAAKWKAVHLLQWMVEGDLQEGEEREEKTEHDFLLNKILCGLEIAAPIPLELELSETEKEEALNLLKAVIENWTIIKKSSVHALRITFLQKEGRIKRGNQDWDLYIQRDSAVEIVIDRLPWTISMIRLPWSEATVFVEW